MQFAYLAQTLTQAEAVSSRLQITQILADLWGKLEPDEIWQTANLIQGQLRPPYEQLVFNLSEKMIARALALLALAQGGLGGGTAVDLFGVPDEETTLAQIKKIHRTHGDWGETAADVHQQLFADKSSEISINEVYDQLVAIAQIAGSGSQQEKLEQMVALLRQVDNIGAKFIVRMVIGKLRLGFSTMTILDSLSWAVTGDKSESKPLENLWQKKADAGLLARSYLGCRQLSSDDRLQKLQAEYQVSVGVPVVPALCQRLSSSTDIIEKVGTVIAEPKYDGLRIQIHVRREGGQTVVQAFTRSLENVSAMFPELQEFAENLPVHQAIFDSEAVGFSAATGEMLPFQETMSRRRIHDVDEKSREIRMKFFVFDILLQNDRELVATPLAERKQILRQIVTESHVAQMTAYQVISDPDKLKAFHQEQLQAGIEGMVAKGELSHYQSGRKGWHWVKIKEIEGTRGKLNDTLDLVIMGYYSGQGRRHEMGVGAILAGVRTSTDEYVTISKIGSGFTDENLASFKAQADKLEASKKPVAYNVNKVLTPDVWLEPQLVAEIAADELTRSSMHTSGYGLRFPRIIRWRADKTAEQATTLAELANIKIDTGGNP